MNAWKTIMETNFEETCLDSLCMLKESYAKYPDFVEYVEGSIPGPVEVKIVRTLD
jgi:hypothetical protein